MGTLVSTTGKVLDLHVTTDIIGEETDASHIKEETLSQHVTKVVFGIRDPLDASAPVVNASKLSGETVSKVITGMDRHV